MNLVVSGPRRRRLAPLLRCRDRRGSRHRQRRRRHLPAREGRPEAEVAVDGEPVEPRELRYLLVNKPRGVASTRSDPHAERVIVDLVPERPRAVPGGPARRRHHGPDRAHQRRRAGQPPHAPALRCAQDVRGARARQGRASGRSADLRAGVELEDGPTAPAEARLEKQSAKTALVELTSTRAASARCGACWRRSACRWRSSTGAATGRSPTRASRSAASASSTATRSRRLRRAGEEVDRRTDGDDPGEPVDLIPGI